MHEYARKGKKASCSLSEIVSSVSHMHLFFCGEGGPGYAEHSGGFHLVSSAFFETSPNHFFFHDLKQVCLGSFPGMGIGDVVAFFGGNGTRSVGDCGIAFFGGLNAESGGGRFRLLWRCRFGSGAIGSALGAAGGGSSSPDDSLESMRFVKVLGKSLQRIAFPLIRPKRNEERFPILSRFPASCTSP